MLPLLRNMRAKKAAFLFSLYWNRETPCLRRIQFSFILSQFCVLVFRLAGFRIDLAVLITNQKSVFLYKQHIQRTQMILRHSTNCFLYHFQKGPVSHLSFHRIDRFTYPSSDTASVQPYIFETYILYASISFIYDFSYSLCFSDISSRSFNYNTIFLIRPG